MRFIVGHVYKIPEALKHLVKAGEWREKFGTNTILERWEADQSPEARLLRDTWPMGLIAQDDEGRPVQLFRFSCCDFTGYLRETSIEHMMNFNVWRFEKNLAGNPRGEAIIIMDLGYTEETDPNGPAITSMMQLRSYVSGLMTYLKALTGVADPFYPGNVP